MAAEVWIGTLQMTEMEEFSRQSGKIVLEMVRFKYRAGEEELGAVALVLDLANAFERVSLPVVWAWATHLSFPRKILRCYAGTSSTRGECSSKDVWRSRCGPSRRSCHNQSGVACSYVLLYKMR